MTGDQTIFYRTFCTWLLLQTGGHLSQEIHWQSINASYKPTSNNPNNPLKAISWGHLENWGQTCELLDNKKGSAPHLQLDLLLLLVQKLTYITLSLSVCSVQAHTKYIQLSACKPPVTGSEKNLLLYHNTSCYSTSTRKNMVTRACHNSMCGILSTHNRKAHTLWAVVLF